MKKENVILVIEDDEDIRNTLKFVLEKKGHTLITASNGQQGLEILHKIPRPCIILLDLMMPVMNGWEFVNNIKLEKKFATIPIIAITAFSDQMDFIRVNSIIKKPLNLNVLYATIQQWCGDCHATPEK